MGTIQLELFCIIYSEVVKIMSTHTQNKIYVLKWYL